MRRTHLGVQAAIVLTMVASVSWPQYRPARSPQSSQSVWRYAPSAVLQARTNDAARFAGDARTAAVRPGAGLNNATFTTGETTGRNPLAAQVDPYYLTPAAVAVLGGRVNALLGFARTSMNMPIPHARVILRNLRTGQVQARTIANDRGEFSFVDVDPNAYVVELIGPDGSVVAASPLVSLARGDVQKTELRVASSAMTVTASFGSSLSPSLAQATALAASSDVPRTTTAQTTQESPR